MRKTNLFKMITIMVVFTMVALVSISVFAADGDFQELTLGGNNTSSTNTTTNTTGNTTNNTTGNNTAAKNTNTNTNLPSTINNTVNKNTNTNLPKTGVADSVPVIALVAVFAVSSVYAFKKINDYKNI